jgi:hypothetical protein
MAFVFIRNRRIAPLRSMVLTGAQRYIQFAVAVIAPASDLQTNFRCTDQCKVERLWRLSEEIGLLCIYA